MANQKQVFKIATHLIVPPYRLIYEDLYIHFSQLPTEEWPFKYWKNVHLKMSSVYGVCCIYD